MKGIILRCGSYDDRNKNNLVSHLQTVYPDVYQALMAQGLTDEQIEAGRTNATVIQAVLDARQNVPAAQKMNELYARYQSYHNADDTSKFENASAALGHLLFKNAYIAGPVTDFVLLHKTFDGDDVWAAFTEALMKQTQSRPDCMYPNLTRLVEDFVQKNSPVLRTEFQMLLAKNLTAASFRNFHCETHGSGTWDSFLNLHAMSLQKKFQMFASVESEAKTLFEGVQNIYEANPDHFKGLAAAYISMRTYQLNNNCSALENTAIWYVEDGFVIRAYDERFLSYTIISRMSSLFGYTEECQFAAYVNHDIEQKLSTPEMRQDYHRMLASLNEASPYNGNPDVLQEFTRKYPL